MSERIDHVAESEICINYARATESPTEAHLSMIQAQAHATLALVEEQRVANEQARIANLISLWHGSPVKEEYIGDGERGLLVTTGGVLRPEIREALGLRE